MYNNIVLLIIKLIGTNYKFVIKFNKSRLYVLCIISKPIIYYKLNYIPSYGINNILYITTQYKLIEIILYNIDNSRVIKYVFIILILFLLAFI